jgi:copper chaperone CopZ
MQKVQFHIPDMHCSNCVMRLESIEDELPGILSIQASYHSGKMDVAYDEQAVDLEGILNAIRQKGYQAVLPGEKPV